MNFTTLLHNSQAHLTWKIQWKSPLPLCPVNFIEPPMRFPHCLSITLNSILPYRAFISYFINTLSCFGNLKVPAVATLASAVQCQSTGRTGSAVGEISKIHVLLIYFRELYHLYWIMGQILPFSQSFHLAENLHFSPAFGVIKTWTNFLHISPKIC